jgi:hypothetical protein
MEVSGQLYALGKRPQFQLGREVARPHRESGKIWRRKNLTLAENRNPSVKIVAPITQ